MTGAQHMTPKQCDELPTRIKEFLTLHGQLQDLIKKHAETMGRLAHDLGPKKVALIWGGGKVIESDGRTTIKIIESDIEVLS